jgi:hypothetical protein
MTNLRVLLLGICGLFLALLLALLLVVCVWGNGWDNLAAWHYTDNALSEKFGPQTGELKYQLMNVVTDRNSGARLYTIHFKYNDHTGVITLLCTRHSFTTQKIEEDSG